MVSCRFLWLGPEFEPDFDFFIITLLLYEIILLYSNVALFSYTQYGPWLDPWFWGIGISHEAGIINFDLLRSEIFLDIYIHIPLVWNCFLCFCTLMVTRPIYHSLFADGLCFFVWPYIKFWCRPSKEKRTHNADLFCAKMVWLPEEIVYKKGNFIYSFWNCHIMHACLHFRELRND